jgi:hypothetical protein
MNNTTTLFFLCSTMLLTSCASKLKTKSIPLQETYSITYIVKYPSLPKGVLKTQAAKFRKEFLDVAISEILVNIYRMSHYGPFPVNEVSDIEYSTPSFKYTSASPVTMEFLRNGSYYNEVKAKSYNGNSYVNHNEVLYPLAYMGELPEWRWSEPPIFVTIPVEQKLFIEDYFPVFTREILKRDLKSFYERFEMVDGKKAFNRFLNNIDFAGTIGKDSAARPHISEIFSKSEYISYGMGGGHVETEVSTTQDFALSHKSSKFLWGILLVLNSHIDIQRTDKETLIVNIKVPYEEIKKKYKTKAFKDFIDN